MPYIQNTKTGQTVWHDPKENYVLQANEVDIGNTYVAPPPLPANLLQQYKDTCKELRRSTDATFRRIQEAILSGRISATDPITKSWLDFFYACTLGMSATSVGVVPVKPTTYPIGT